MCYFNTADLCSQKYYEEKLVYMSNLYRVSAFGPTVTLR